MDIPNCDRNKMFKLDMILSSILVFFPIMETSTNHFPKMSSISFNPSFFPCVSTGFVFFFLFFALCLHFLHSVPTSFCRRFCCHRVADAIAPARQGQGGHGVLVRTAFFENLWAIQIVGYISISNLLPLVSFICIYSLYIYISSINKC